MKEALSLFIIGCIVAIGRFLASKELFAWRTLIGRSILGGALGLITYPIVWIISKWIPVPVGTEMQIMVGLACALSCAGTEILEKAIGAFVFKVTGKDINPEPPKAP